MKHRRIQSIAAAMLCFVAVDARAGEAATTKKPFHLAFVLLSETRILNPDEITRSFTSFASKEETIRRAASPPVGDAAAQEVLEFELRPQGSAFVALVPAAIPGGEADAGVRFSVSAMGTDWKLPAHRAHLIVTLRDPPASVIQSLSTFTSLLAAVAESSGAVGIYWGAAGATHDAAFFVKTARSRDWTPKLMLWTGVSVARESDGRLSLLSLGMGQLRLPDLLMIASSGEGNEALATFFDLLTYAVERGKPLPEGDTIGRTPDDRHPVSYVPSPVDPTTKVWRVEFE